MLRKIGVVATLACLVSLPAPAVAKPPLTAFGAQPAVRAAELSPDGTKVAYIRRIDGEDVLALYDFKTKTASALTRVGELKARDVFFVGDDYVVILASKTARTFGYRGKYEASAAFAYNMTTKKIVRLLNGGVDNLHPAQSGLGRIVAVDPDKRHVFMPAYTTRGSSDGQLDLIRVDLDSGRGARMGGKSGNDNTVDWLLDANGEVVAREDFSETRGQHVIWAYTGNKPTKVYSKDGKIAELSLVGVSRANGSLLALSDSQSDFLTLFEMSRTDGKMTPIAQRPDADAAGIIIDQNRMVHGVRYSGMQPSYEMFDKTLDAEFRALATQLPNMAVNLDSWSNDWSRILLHVEGGAAPERYMVWDRKAKSLVTIANSRPEITPADVGEVMTIKYKARDGLEIPAIVIWPAGSKTMEERKNLPLVVLPHGGPESYDSVGFDWLAQFIANEGYMVLQPNFRGSAGFGGAFIDAGRKQWGRKMQDDVTDGAAAMGAMGWADPKRVCIVGWSYGGYAALAGGALTPDAYRCVASVAGVSDLRDMLNYERSRFGADSQTYNYWKMLIGDPGEDKDAIDAVSPARRADAFKAPVLLIHGADDLIVPASQSNRMNDALKGAGKKVQYIRIGGDDHSLLQDESRKQALTALGEFLATNLKAQ